jgi:hypothetical protein
MIKLLNLLVDTTPGLNYHLKHNLPISENVYRYSSKAFIELFNEARALHRDGAIQLCEEDRILLETTDIGEYAEYDDKIVPLDLPFAYTDEVKVGMLVVGRDNSRFRVVDIEGDKYYLKSTTDPGYTVIFPDDFLKTTEPVDFWDFFTLERITEADYHGKNVPLGKPKRGGPKKFYVYVRDPKTKKVKKVNFGGTTGLSVKIDDPKARHSFAARHKCATEKNKLSPNYWGCHIGRYWKSLGGSKNFSGYW